MNTQEYFSLFMQCYPSMQCWSVWQQVQLSNWAEITAKDSWAEILLHCKNARERWHSHVYTDITYVCRSCIHIIYLSYIICILPESICKSYVCVCLYVPSSFHDYYGTQFIPWLLRQGTQWNIHPLKSEWETKSMPFKIREWNTLRTTSIFKSQ